MFEEVSYIYYKPNYFGCSYTRLSSFVLPLETLSDFLDFFVSLRKVKDFIIIFLCCMLPNSGIEGLLHFVERIFGAGLVAFADSILFFFGFGFRFGWDEECMRGLAVLPSLVLGSMGTLASTISAGFYKFGIEDVCNLVLMDHCVDARMLLRSTL